MHHCKLSSSAAKLKLKSPPLLSIIGNVGGGGCIGRSFGRRLEDQPTMAQSAMESAVQPLPVVLSVCCDYLRCHLSSEGLFRIEGSKVRQRDLRARLERGLPIREGTPVQDVSSLLKAWLRELPEPLLPPRLAAALAEASPLERRVRLLRLLNQLMPARQLAALRYLCQLLRSVAAAAGSNRMTAANLATCLGPSLHGGGDSGGPDVARLNAAVALLIEFAPEIGGGCGGDADDEAVNAVAAALQTPPTTPQHQEKQQQQPLQKLLRRRSSGSSSLSSALRAVGRAVGRLASRSRSRSPRRAAAAAGATVAGCSGSPVSLVSTSSTSASTSASSTSTTTTATTEKQLAGFRFDPSACHTPIIVRCHRRQNSDASLKRAGPGVILVGSNNNGKDTGDVVDGGFGCVRRRRRLLIERISAGRKASVDLCRLTSPPPQPLPPSTQVETPQQQQKQQPLQPPSLTTLPTSSQPTRTPLRRLQRSPRDSLHVLRQARRIGGAASPRRPDRLRGVRRLWSSPLRLSQNARLCLLRAEGLRPA